MHCYQIMIQKYEVDESLKRIGTFYFCFFMIYYGHSCLLYKKRRGLQQTIQLLSRKRIFEVGYNAKPLIVKGLKNTAVKVGRCL